MAFPFGSLIGAAGSLLGGLIGKGSSDDAREAAEAHSARQEALQREFAQNSIRWRVEDAKRAGIHPLAALGGAGASYSPSTFMSGGDNSMATAVARSSQDIGRAVDATRTRGERVDAYTSSLRQLQLDSGRVDLEIKKADLASRLSRLSQSSSPGLPGSDMFVPGQGDSGLVRMIRQDVTRSGRLGTEPRGIPGVGYVVMPDGTRMPVKSKGATEQLEDDIPGNLKHFMLRTFGPMFDPDRWKPSEAPRRGYHWQSDWKGDYYEKKDAARRPYHPSERLDVYRSNRR